MAETERRLVDRIMDPSFLEGLDARPLNELKEMRTDCSEAENELSFERRLCQARVDILKAELDRRAGRRTGDLVSNLPEILASEARAPSDSPLPSRAPDFSTPRSADVPRRRVEEIVGEQTLSQLGELPTEEIERIITSLESYERNVSGRRKALHEVIDRVHAEIVKRYEADPSAALG